MKEPITVYTWVKTSESLPIGKATARKGAFTGELQIRKDGAYFYYENTILDYEFSDPRLYEFEWLKPQELICFTEDELEKFSIGLINAMVDDFKKDKENFSSKRVYDNYINNQATENEPQEDKTN